MAANLSNNLTEHGNSLSKLKSTEGIDGRACFIAVQAKYENRELEKKDHLVIIHYPLTDSNGAMLRVWRMNLVTWFLLGLWTEHLILGQAENLRTLGRPCSSHMIVTTTWYDG
jgi:hypothetical protein